MPDAGYDEYSSSNFIKEYVFLGGCLPSLSRVTSAMVAASRLRLERVENIGKHYYHTLLLWRKSFQVHHSEILKVGFNEHLVRTWELLKRKSRHFYSGYRVYVRRPRSVEYFFRLRHYFHTRQVRV
ncbi:hypothetical protein SUGI_1115570 [Cryptomeria japonica]|nr:hypothetical protein SUGI_1115570 [Cryptomeria japonica]